MRKVLMLRDDPQLRKSMGDAARKWILENSNWKKNARKVLAIAEALCT